MMIADVATRPRAGAMHQTNDCAGTAGIEAPRSVPTGGPKSMRGPGFAGTAAIV
jgi:hypothetical protein